MTTVGPFQPEPPREPAQQTAQSAQETAQSAQETAQSAQQTAQSAQGAAESSEQPKNPESPGQSQGTPPTEGSGSSQDPNPSEGSQETPPTEGSPDSGESDKENEKSPDDSQRADQPQDSEDSGDDGPIKARFGPSAPEPRMVMSEEERAASEHLQRALHNERTGGGEVHEGELQAAREEHLRRTAGIRS